MLLGGKERTLAEYTQLLDDVGYRIEQTIIPTPTELCVIEAQGVAALDAVELSGA
jgi:hypothetical protein